MSNTKPTDVETFKTGDDAGVVLGEIEPYLEDMRDKVLKRAFGIIESREETLTGEMAVGFLCELYGHDVLRKKLVRQMKLGRQAGGRITGIESDSK